MLWTEPARLDTPGRDTVITGQAHPTGARGPTILDIHTAHRLTEVIGPTVRTGRIDPARITTATPRQGIHITGRTVDTRTGGRGATRIERPLQLLLYHLSLHGIRPL